MHDCSACTYILPNTEFKLILGLYTWFGSQGAGTLGHITSKRALTSKVVSVCVCVPHMSTLYRAEVSNVLLDNVLQKCLIQRGHLKLARVKVRHETEWIWVVSLQLSGEAYWSH